MNKLTKLIHRDNLGECLQTALRKGCDSQATSLAWNLIYLLDKEENAWTEFLDLVWIELNTPDTVFENAWERIKAAAEKIKYGNSERNALRLTLQYFDDTDFEGMSYLLYD